jgi:uncharacterized protein
MTVKDRDLKGCTLITGFHGIGETGYIATSYLIHALNASRIGFIDVAHLPPFVATSSIGLVTPFEIYRRGRLVLIKLEFSPHRGEEAELAKVLAEWAMKSQLREAVLIGGLDSRLRNGRHKIRLVATEAFLARSSFFNNHPILEPGLFVYGPLAVMLAKFEMHGFPAVAVLPYASTERVDPAAAATAVKVISKAYGIKVDVSDLEEDAKKIEAELSKRVKQADQLIRGMYA